MRGFSFFSFLRAQLFLLFMSMRTRSDFFDRNWPVHENPCFLGKQHKSNTRQIQIITRQTQFITRQTPPFVSVHKSATSSFSRFPALPIYLTTLSYPLSRPSTVIQLGDWLIFPAIVRSIRDHSIDAVSLSIGKNVPVPLLDL